MTPFTSNKQFSKHKVVLSKHKKFKNNNTLVKGVKKSNSDKYYYKGKKRYFKTQKKSKQFLNRNSNTQVYNKKKVNINTFKFKKLKNKTYPKIGTYFNQDISKMGSSTSRFKRTSKFYKLKKLVLVSLKEYLKNKLIKNTQSLVKNKPQLTKTKNIKRNKFAGRLLRKLKIQTTVLKQYLKIILKKLKPRTPFIKNYVQKVLGKVRLKSDFLEKAPSFFFKKDKRNINKFVTKKNFVKFLKTNNLYNILNLRQDFPYPNFLQTKSEIQRATIFRDLVNKEEAYYQTVNKSPLIILLSPKPKNIYITVYTLPESSSGYKILWKKSTGMLEKVEGQLSFAALVELFNKLNIFLAKEFLSLQNPIRLIIKSTKYYGTNHLIQNFVKMFQKNMNLNYIYFMYKYRKRFNFFNSYANLINDSVFNYMSSIWLKFLKLIRRTKLPNKHIFSGREFKSFNKFFYEFLL